MKSLLASVRDGGGLDRADHAVQLLEDEWRKHGDVSLERLWTEQKRLFESATGDSVVVLSELIKTDLRCRFARGQTPAVAHYLDQFPELNDAGSRVLSLIYEEFCLAEERGDGVDVDAFCNRYPRWKESLVSQLQYHRLLSQAAGARPQTPPFPEAGESFEEFELVSLLGRGGTSRVFLARDLSLGGKQVVLKVSLDRGREPQAQGALDHPHIVPVNSVAFGDNGMRGLSMPYRPGLPLDEVIKRVNPAAKPRSALALWETLVRAAEPASDAASPSVPFLLTGTPPHAPRGDGWEGFPVRGGYAQSVAWVVKVIAEALHYAHGQRTFHRDVKPANVLLTVQHGPQLLDFNLAESPHSASQAQAAMHGGTLPYMAPEQIEAFLNPDLWGKVGAQADIYSLGLVLRELLTGQAPEIPAETLAPARAMRVLLDRRPLLDVSVRRANPTIPHALEAIVARCLAVSVDDRYHDAGALVEDLDRFLHRAPLVHAVNPSRRERSANWAARNLVKLAVAAVVGAVFLLPAAYVLGRAAERASSQKGPPGPIENSPHLTQALEFLNARKAGLSIEPLVRLKDLYPKSSLPRMYLSFAYAAMRVNHTEAVDSFREALAMKNARSELRAWMSRDSRLPERLDQFATHLFDKAKDIETGDTLTDVEQEEAIAKQHLLAREAAEISLEVRGKSDPDSESYLILAKAQQELTEYESVIARATDAIAWIAAETPADKAALKECARKLYIWRRLRSRALTKLARRLRDEGSESARKEALNTLDRAQKDLHDCSTFVTLNNNMPERRTVERVRVEWLMTRVDVDLDLGRLDDAGTHLAHARTSLATYDALSNAIGQKEMVDDFNDRLRAIADRFQVESKRASAAAARASQVTAVNPPHGE